MRGRLNTGVANHEKVGHRHDREHGMYKYEKKWQMGNTSGDSEIQAATEVYCAPVDLIICSYTLTPSKKPPLAQ